MALALMMILILPYQAFGAAMGEESIPECGIPNMITADKRAFVSLDGVEMPFGIVEYTWSSARIGNYMLYYLVSEGLGIKAQLSGQADGSMAGVQMVAGCLEGGNTQSTETCGVVATKHHVAWETWGGNRIPAMEELQERLKPKEPINLGSIGFDALEGLYFFGNKIDEIYSDMGKPIGYYKSWNFSWNDYSSYFSSWEAIPASRMKKCKNSCLSPKQGTCETNIQKYRELYGDVSGTEQVDVNGEMKWAAKCEGGEDGTWWLSPACRSQPTKCIPVISGGDGWSTDAFMQKFAAFDMPFAFGVAASWSEYTQLPKDYNMGIYWWQPDSTFISSGPVLVEFPANDETAWAQGLFTTNAKGVLLMKWTHNQVFSFAPRANQLVQSAVMSLAQFEKILLEMGTYGFSERVAACNWLKNNTAVWQRWIPDAASCREGDGVVDTTGEFVVNKADAVSCTACTKGKYSVTSGDGLSRQCVDCAEGKSSERGMNACTNCSAGRFNANVGAGECEVCIIGKFISSVGSTACSQCEEGTIAADLGMSSCVSCDVGTYVDTRQATECTRCSAGKYANMGGQSACTKCAGDFTSEQFAKSASDCFCPTNTYHGSENYSEGVCLSCPEGFTCLGGLKVNARRLSASSTPHNMPVLKAEYYATERNPYKAFSCVEAETLCLGGPVETYKNQCGGGRSGLQCAACDHGQSSNTGEACTDCTGGPYVWYPLALIVFVIGMTVIHRVASSSKGGAFAQLPMFSVMSLIVNQAQYLALLQTYDLNWPGAFDSLLKVMMIFLFDMNVTSVSCYFGYSLAALYLPGLVVPLGVVMVMWVMMAVTKVASQATGGKTKSMHVDYVINTLGLVLTGLSVAVFKSILTIFECRPNPSAGDTLANFDGFECYGDDVGPLIPFTVLSTAIFILGGVSGYMYVIVQGPSKYHSSDAFRKRFQFVLKRWHPTYYYFGALVLVRNLAMCLVSVISTQGLTQVLMLTLIFAPFFCATLVAKPWRDIVANWTDGLLSGAFLLIMFLAAMVAEDPTDSTRKFLGWLMISTMMIAMFIVFLICMDMLKLMLTGKGIWIRGSTITQEMIDDFLGTFGKVHFLEENGHDEARRDVKAFLSQLPQADVLTLLWLTANVKIGLFGDQSQKVRRSISGISPVAAADSSDLRIENANAKRSSKDFENDNAVEVAEF